MRVEDVPTGPVSKAADSIIGQGALGAVLIVMLGLFIWLFVKFITSQTERVAEKEKAAERSERANAEYAKAQLENARAFEKLAAAQGELTKAIDRNNRLIEDNTRAVNGLIVQLVQVQRRPSTGTMAAVRLDPRRERDG